MRIDSHLHFWQYHPVKDSWITDDMQVIQRDFMPDDLSPLLVNNKIDACIAVQAGQTEAETRFLLDLAVQFPFIKGVVGWVDLKSPQLPERLAFYNEYPSVKGFRHIVQAEPPGFLLQDNFLGGIKDLEKYGYTYDILVYPHQLKEVIDFLEKVPGQSFVIDHCAKPDIRNGELRHWSESLNIISENPNVFVKLSGLLTEADWKNWQEKDIFHCLDIVFDAFGIDRLMYGSDWPVALLAGQYETWLVLIEKYLNTFSKADKEKIFGLNAATFYKINT